MSEFKWNTKKQKAAIYLADGFTVAESAKEAGVSEREVYRWKKDIEFQTEVDRLSLMVGIANRGERLRLAKKIIRDLIGKQHPTQKDLLEWVKYAQSETDGVKLDLAALIDDAASMAGGGSEGSGAKKGAEKEK